MKIEQLPEIDCNSLIDMELTAAGARAFKEYFQNMNGQLRPTATKTFRTDYKAGDIVTDSFWEIMLVLDGYWGVDEEKPFVSFWLSK